MKLYRERGGLFLILCGAGFFLGSLYTEYLYEGVLFAIASATYVIFGKLERISNALNDLHNDREV